MSELIQITPWVGFDLDRTLAHYDRWQGVTHVGRPVLPILAQLCKELKAGNKCKIFTARVSRAILYPDNVEMQEETRQCVAAIHAWLKKHDLPELEVTCIKDFGMFRM